MKCLEFIHAASACCTTKECCEAVSYLLYHSTQCCKKKMLRNSILLYNWVMSLRCVPPPLRPLPVDMSFSWLPGRDIARDHPVAPTAAKQFQWPAAPRATWLQRRWRVGDFRHGEVTRPFLTRWSLDWGLTEMWVWKDYQRGCSPGMSDMFQFWGQTEHETMMIQLYQRAKRENIMPLSCKEQTLGSFSAWKNLGKGRVVKQQILRKPGNSLRF